MNRHLLLIAATLLAACTAKPPQVRSAKVRRENIVSTLTTNGRVEPYTWTAVRAERDGSLSRVLVKAGQRVTAGQILAEIRSPESAADIAAAEAREAQAAANVLTLERGGAPQALAEIDSQLRAARDERSLAAREVETMKRLVDRNAATKQELTAAQDRLSTADTLIRGLEARRDSLAGTWESRAAAEAQHEEAQASTALAKRRASLAVIRATQAGEVYNLPVRAGQFIRAGDLIAEIGQTNRLKAVVYVDEPLLGRVARGMPVRITWDALPDRDWTGTVEQLPVQVIALGTRQVGEVTTVLDNRENKLPAGANINVEIQSAQASNVLTIPKEALLRRSAAQGVYVITSAEGKATLTWREVRPGVASLTRTEITGLNEGDLIALAGDLTLTPGMAVMPVPE